MKFERFQIIPRITPLSSGADPPLPDNLVEQRSVEKQQENQGLAPSILLSFSLKIVSAISVYLI